MESGRLRKIGLVQGLLEQAPPGELEYVSQDLRKILGDDGLFFEAAHDVFESFNEQQLVPMRFESSASKILVSRAGRVGPSEYLDPSTSEVVTVDHFSRVATKSRPALKREMPSTSIEPFRAAMEDAMKPYMEECYPDGQCTVYGHDEVVEGFPGVTVCISSSTLRAKNFLNGRWTSTWVAALRPDGVSAHTSGDMKAKVHYFEDSNVQLDTSYRASSEARGEDLENLADALVYIFSAAEAGFLKDLEDQFAGLTRHTLKNMRRALPRTGMKFPWSSQSMRLVGEIRCAQPKPSDADDEDDS